jgi:hypothetical protein
MRSRVFVAVVAISCVLSLTAASVPGPQCAVVGWYGSGVSEPQRPGDGVCAPVRLFHPDAHTRTKIVVDQDGLEALRAITTPVSVVTVVGRARSGKSFTLDTLIGVQPRHGFAVGHTERTETFGAYVWPRPLIGRDGTTGVVVIDTEGLGMGPATYDKALLLMSVMASSMIIYHVSDLVYLDDVTRLYGMACLVDDYVSRGIVSAEDDLWSDEASGSRDGSSLVRLPSIAWTVQRFSLAATDRGAQSVSERDLAIVMDEWMAERPNEDNDPAVAQFNYTVRSVKRAFRSHSAYLIPDATTDAFGSSELDTVRPDALPAGYRSAMDRLREEVLATAPRSVAGRPRTGADVAALIEALVPAANDRIDVLGDRVVDAILGERVAVVARDLAAFVDGGIRYPLDADLVSSLVADRALELGRSLVAGVAGSAALSAGARAHAGLAAVAELEAERARAINAAASEAACLDALQAAERFIDDEVARASARSAIGLPQFTAIANAARRRFAAGAVGPARVFQQAVLEASIGRRAAVIEATEIPRVRTAWLVASCIAVVVCQVIISCAGKFDGGTALGCSAALFVVQLGGIFVAGLIVATIFTTPPFTFEDLLATVSSVSGRLPRP